MYKVVVVEDEEIARKGIIFTINWDALNCMIAGEAANGEEGAEVIRRLSPDIIVTDLKMPRMDGVEMIAKLRDQRRLFKPCVQKRDRLYIYHLSFLLPHESGNGTVKRGKFKGI